MSTFLTILWIIRLGWSQIGPFLPFYQDGKEMNSKKTQNEFITVCPWYMGKGPTGSWVRIRPFLNDFFLIRQNYGYYWWFYLSGLLNRYMCYDCSTLLRMDNPSPWWGQFIIKINFTYFPTAPCHLAVFIWTIKITKITLKNFLSKILYSYTYNFSQKNIQKYFYNFFVD